MGVPEAEIPGMVLETETKCNDGGRDTGLVLLADKVKKNERKKMLLMYNG